MTASAAIDALAPRQVLVVDDDPGINRLLQVRLRNLGYEVASATNGEEALAQVEEQPPDMMLLDVSMPGVGGMEVLSSIRARDLDIAIIMTTAFGSERVAIDALRNGANDYLRKPFEPEEFRAVVSRTATQLHLVRQNQALRAQLEAELRHAATIQASLLPQHAPDVPGYDLAAVCIPAREVGGDYYDWQRHPDGRLTITLGDVMGKGLPAALLMATVRAAMRSVVADRPPAAAVEAVSHALAADLERTQSFVTLFHADLDPETATVRWVDAGHGLAIVLGADGQARALGHTGLPLGIDADAPIDAAETRLRPGDTLIVCSDGLAETPEDFARIVALGQSASHTAEALMARMVVAAKGQVPAADDRTAIVITYRGTGA